MGDRLGERRAIDGEALAAGERDLREVVGALGVQRVLAGSARQAQRSSAGGLFEDDVFGRQHADDLDQQPAGDNGASRLLDPGGRQRHPHRQLHIGGGELDPRLAGVDQDPGEDLDGGSLRHPASCDLQLREQLILRADDLHRRELLENGD